VRQKERGVDGLFWRRLGESLPSLVSVSNVNLVERAIRFKVAQICIQNRNDTQKTPTSKSNKLINFLAY
jgi:hypothetical protein